MVCYYRADNEWISGEFQVFDGTLTFFSPRAGTTLTLTKWELTTSGPRVMIFTGFEEQGGGTYVRRQVSVAFGLPREAKRTTVATAKEPA